MTAMAALLLAAPALAVQQPAAGAPSAERMRAAEQALANVDPERVMSDSAYAGTIADHLLLLRTRRGLDAGTRYETESMLAFALARAGGTMRPRPRPTR